MNHSTNTTYLGDEHIEGVEVRGAEPELHHWTRHGGPPHNPGEGYSQMDNDNQIWTLSYTHLPSGNVVTCDGWNGTE